MRLLGSSASPFVAKVRMAAAICDIELSVDAIDTGNEPEALTSVNPLGKIPALVTEDGDAVFDSAVICEYLDRMSGNQLIPQTLVEYRKAKTFESVASGVVDALILCLYEVRFRPEEKRHSDWTDRQTRKADRGLAWLGEHLGELGDQPTIAHCALASLLGWMELRYADKLNELPTLTAWADAFYAANPKLAETKPHL
ncbi:MAG: glutathione S-transferase family protein [Pseudomonadota bacterium]|nr:glutathione S-transferase family protein [Pseudomonadota bacterium]